MIAQPRMAAGPVSRRRLLRAGLGAGALVAAGRTPWPIRAAQINGEADGYAHAEWLVDADWLRAHRDDPGLHLIAFGPANEFAAGHIPGARRVDGAALELGDTSPAAITAWQEQMARLVAGLGIEPDSTVVAYDAGSLYATRPWWVLRYLGHDEVRVLDGGLAAWEAAGGTVATGTDAGLEPVPPVGATPTASTVRSDLLAPLAEVEAALDDSAVVIVDARPPEDYAAGHIPGAVNVPYPQNAASEPPRVWKPATELRAMYEALGVSPDKRIIPYCRTGVRSSVTDFTLRLLGYEDVALFTGSWNEWTSHPELPMTTGPNP